MFKAYQWLGHPGKGELWAEACEIQCTADVKASASADTLSPQVEIQTSHAEAVQGSGGVLTVVVGAVANLVSDLAGFVQSLF